MTRSLVASVSFLLYPVLVTSLLNPWRFERGRLNCQSFSEPLFRTASRSPQHPLFLNTKTVLNIYIDEPPVKPQTDAIYTPEPTEIPSESPILHKVHKVIEDVDAIDPRVHEKIEDPLEDRGETEDTVAQETSEEDLSNIEYHEVTYYDDPGIECKEHVDDDDDKEIYPENSSPSYNNDVKTLNDDNLMDRGPVLFS